MMSSKVAVFLIVFLSLCMSASQENDLDDIIDQIFNGNFYYDKNKAIGSMDSLIIKNVATASRYNFVLSPLCLKMALYSLAEAAIGNTRAELITVLSEELNNATKDKYTMINNYIITINKNIINKLKGRYEFFVLGSHIFVSDDIELGQQAVYTATETFGTQLKTVNRRDPYAAVSYINSFVTNATKGTVHDSFNENDVTDMAMLVLNTIFFEGNFRHTFSPKETAIRQFYISPTVIKRVDFMHVVDFFSYRYSNKLDAKILGLPYNEPLEIFFIVPKSLTGLNRVIENLSVLGDELNEMTKTYVDVTLPKFKLTYTSRLNGLLKRLGVEEAFQNTAQFPNLGSNKLQSNWLKISSIMQRFDFGINEYGSGVGQPQDLVKDGPFNATEEVLGNRPFLFALQYSSVQKIVLIGRVSDPSTSQGYFEVV